MQNNSLFYYRVSNPYSFESIGEKIRKENQGKIYKNLMLAISVITMFIALIELFNK